MDSLADIPDNVVLTERAAKDAAWLLRRDRVKFKRVWEDLKCLGRGTLPQPPKKLKGFNPALWQIDSGDFRIFMIPDGYCYIIRGIIGKADQKKRFKGIR